MEFFLKKKMLRSVIRYKVNQNSWPNIANIFRWSDDETYPINVSANELNDETKEWETSTLFRRKTQPDKLLSGHLWRSI